MLAAIYPNVYFDVATCVPPFTEAIQLQVWRTALAMVPLSRIQASTDAAGLSEQIALGARQARRTLGIALGELVEIDALRRDRGRDRRRRRTGRHGTAAVLRRVAWAPGSARRGNWRGGSGCAAVAASVAAPG